MFGDFGMADIALGTSFLNATYAKFEVDAPRWPALAAYVDRVLGHEAFAKRREADEAMMSGGYFPRHVPPTPHERRAEDGNRRGYRKVPLPLASA